jgi:5-methylthioadenosine/S-adenosylhomocysteine deaminase
MRETEIGTRGILTGGENSRWIEGGSIVVRDGRLVALRKSARRPSVDLSGRIAIPGLIQTHIHLCQTAARGLADDLPLLEWLKERILPYENSLTPSSLRASVRIGLREILLSGTTCILDMGTLRHANVIAEEMAASGIRGYTGKCLMDRNDLLPTFKEETDRALSETRTLAKRWQGKEDRIRWAFSPRFALTCSETLMKESHALLKEFPATLFHTHASENLAEMASVQKRHGMRNVEYLEALGVLSERSCLAHCVHLSEGEISLLALRQSRVLHCPSANLKLESGIADIVTYRKRGIPTSLGCDGAACNNHLDLWGEMRLASLLQKPKHGARAMSAAETFRMATWEGAKALHWADEIGSLEEGKNADVVFVDLPKELFPRRFRTEEELLAALVYSGRPERVRDVMIDGRWIVRNGVLKGW